VRVAICGWPRAGKTSLAALAAAKIGVAPRSTDELLGTHDWSAASAEASTWFDAPGPFVLEGVALPRSLRKWLRRNPTGKPCDVAVFLSSPFVALSEGQERMGKGCNTVWQEILPELLHRGVTLGKAPERGCAAASGAQRLGAVLID
jgi:hypothetical protein